ncbi:hypothetical protein F443_08608 [Phytophthora nicotianae P1569]|uniref:ZSWIM3 N-terminal domain-containing protein n=1 Tax=Phytophthora nicotianae P1569 TaxID=1317065 RepID=V9F6H7_PHYNI|nr:hypothetical protein F443_08607 [Phytophthora nicotianae P1569]ETI47104.1 hypothetical protein F443_08608 [Phytophthora nicotianae P1569]
MPDDSDDGSQSSDLWEVSSPTSSRSCSSDNSDRGLHAKKSRFVRKGKRERTTHKKRSQASSRCAIAVEDAENDGCEIAVLDELVYTPELDGKVFESWDVLEAYLKTYSRRTFQIYSVRTNTPVRKRNQRIKENKSDYTLIPEEVQFYNKTYVCTHHGDPLHNRSRGTRPQQSSRKIGCNAQINACVQETGNWEVRITKQISGHNHVVGSEAYQTYHEARVVSDDDVAATVNTLHRAGANRKRILEYITENTTVVP